MKITPTTLLVCFSTLLLTSCGACKNYQRSQAEKDALSRGKQVLLEAESSKKSHD